MTTAFSARVAGFTGVIICGESRRARPDNLFSRKSMSASTIRQPIFGYNMQQSPSESKTANRVEKQTLKKAESLKHTRRLRIHDRRREDDTVPSHKDNRSSFCRLLLWWKASQDFRTPYIDKRRRVRSKENRHRFGLGEVLAIERQQFRSLCTRFCEHVARPVVFRRFRCAVRG